MIGIVGGVGPFAGAALLQRIIEETKASTDQEHVPVILWSVPGWIPDRTDYLEGRVKTNPAIPISRILLELEKSGVTVAGVPCNTAHSPEIYDEIKISLQHVGSHIKLVSILDETIRHIKEKYPTGTSVGIMSTTGTWLRKIYRTPLENAGFKVLDAETREQQEIIHQAVYNKEFGIKAQSSPVTERARKTLIDTAEQLIARGAKAIILGCTEMPLAITEREIKNIEILDSVRLLARGLIREFAPEKLK